MKMNLTVLLDEETRKQIREGVLSEARKIARSLVDLTINKEVERLAGTLATKLGADSYRMQEAVTKALREIVLGCWSDIAVKIDKLIEESANKVVQKKLADKTVFEAERQHDYVVGIVRKELKTGVEIESIVRKELRKLLGES